MLTFTGIFVWIKQIFNENQYNDSLKRYVVSHHPKTPGDVENLERQWSYQRHSGGGWWL